MTIPWIIIIILSCALISMFTLLIFKGGSNTMLYPTEKDKVGDDKSLYVNISVYKKDEYRDSCILELVEGEVSKSGNRCEYHFEARIVKI